MKIATWNVNGIRAAEKKGFHNWLQESDADIICIQETKAQPEQLEQSLICPDGYSSHWHSASKKGYSGVAFFTRIDPIDVKMGIGVPEIDSEGRVITAEFDQFVLINAYFPNSQREHARLKYKLDFCNEMHRYCDSFVKRGSHVIVTGDFNIAHTEIDLKNPKTNQNNAGFLPEEREWMSQFLNSGYCDAFREFEKGPNHYTWWSYRPGVREKNIGWRLDYFVVDDGFKSTLQSCKITPNVFGSDHCPVLLEI